MANVVIGDLVQARGRRWLVQSAIDGRPAAHRLVCIDDDAQGETLDVCLGAERTWRGLSDEWSGLASALPAEANDLGAHLRVTEWGTASAADRSLFQAPFRSGIRLDPYQLLPLRKALDLPRANLLIADDVGLGKTVEAGLIVRELLLRRRIDFVVVAAPASMILQWQDEMAQKFGLDLTAVDAEHLAWTRRMRGFGANPWALGSFFALSHAVLAEDAYAGPLRDSLGAFRPGSLLILDEAHHAAPSGSGTYATESQMTRAVRDLAGRFEHRLFLSATPHNGHSNAFSTLLEILDPQRFTRGIPVEPEDLEPVMVRRLKEDLRQLGEPFPERRVEPVVISGLPEDAPELRLAAMLADMVAGAGGSQSTRFLLALFQQRLFSSLAAFHRSLSTHRRTLERRALVESEEPEDDDRIATETRRLAGRGEPLALTRIDEMLALADAHRHRPDARVERIVEWIRAEMLDGTAWLDRRLIIFTEWEDTHRWLVARLEEALDGLGVDVEGRILRFTGRADQDTRDRIKIEFNASFEKTRVRILVCTDAAREGINLQARCHDLFHFDLPWNPSRLEQRNGRIDRKLQPSAIVTCRYFSYAQREEDRVLDALVAKTERIRRELGAAGQVIREDIEGRLRAGIGRGEARELARVLAADAPRGVEAARREMGDESTTRLERLRQENDRLAAIQERARRRIGVDPRDLRVVVDQALGLVGRGTALRPGDFSVPEALHLSPDDPAFAGDPSWQSLLDELRPGRPPGARELARWRAKNPPRGLVFAPPTLRQGQPEPQDVVQLHLEHRLVKRLVSRFRARGFADALDRVAIVPAGGPQARVVLISRLALYGPAGQRLHEEIIPVTARWRDADRELRPLSPFGEQGEAATLAQLHEALRGGGSVRPDIAERIAAWVARDVADLRSHAEERARTAEEVARGQLQENGEREAAAIADLIRRQLARVAAARAEWVPPAQGVLDLRSDEERAQADRERRQKEADRKSWDDKVARLERDIEAEPARVREGYRIAARQVEPVGIVYLWPEGQA
ncbi:ATP-dependent helicase [Rubellimicrobium rubrum]|uniref:ATP-dependent helicase n=1 Tax=Rubellimicrobium rubrum TaxID=2585369 RepID=A0A5C4N2T1_9RHOB|nr:DISARM system SNF2-like helicase DrmD [Rubellimicrobium rubrum]TNC51093.1 ATP-dependent helicase [Rubellimicrobium rubrum]